MSTDLRKISLVSPDGKEIATITVSLVPETGHILEFQKVIKNEKKEDDEVVFQQFKVVEFKHVFKDNSKRFPHLELMVIDVDDVDKKKKGK